MSDDGVCRDELPYGYILNSQRVIKIKQNHVRRMNNPGVHRQRAFNGLTFRVDRETQIVKRYVERGLLGFQWSARRVGRIAVLGQHRRGEKARQGNGQEKSKHGKVTAQPQNGGAKNITPMARKRDKSWDSVRISHS